MTAGFGLDLVHLARVGKIVKESDFRGAMLQLVLEGPELEVGVFVADVEALQVAVQLCRTNLYKSIMAFNKGVNEFQS